jgi:cytochrome bd-type quinol oxidase subunit 1
MITYTYEIVKASLNSLITNQHYLITHTHTLSAATVHSSCVVGGVAGLLLPYSEVKELLPIHMQCGRLHNAAVHLTQQFLHWNLSRIDNKQLRSHKASGD